MGWDAVVLVEWDEVVWAERVELASVVLVE